MTDTSLRLARSRRPRRWSFAPLVALGASILGSSCAPEGASPPAAPEPPLVAVRPVVRETITEWDEYLGRLQAVSRVEVRSRVNGYLKEIHFTDGQMVEVGQLLFVIDPRPYEAQQASALAAVEEAQAALQLRQNDLERAKVVSQTPKAISAEEVDSRAQAVSIANAQVQSAQASLKAAELEVEYTQVRSPLAGRVSRHLVDLGNLVTADQTLLTTVVSLDPIHCYFSADEQAYLKYTRLSRTGDRPSSRDVANPVEVALMDEEGFVHKGRMDFVDNEIDGSTGTIRGRAILPNPDGILIPGLFARIRLLGVPNNNVLLIPEVAIATNQSQRFVFVVDDAGRVVYRPIELGRAFGDRRIILNGLGEGERVVVRGQQRLREGDVVRAQVDSTGESR